MEETPNLRLKKPGLTDNVLISDFNENADVLDMEIGNLKTGMAGKEEAGVAQDAVDALAGAGNTKTVKQLDTELGEHKGKNASSTEAGHMTAADKKKIDGVEEGANKYTHPAAHPATMITEDAMHRFATDAEKTNWNGKETPAGAQEKVNALAGPGNTKTVKQLDDAIATHLAEKASLTKLGHVKAETDSEGKLILPSRGLTTEKFDVPGLHQWVAPQGVDRVYLSGCAGGGAGAGEPVGVPSIKAQRANKTYTSIAKPGGITSFGNLLSLTGGGAVTRSVEYDYLGDYLIERYSPSANGVAGGRNSTSGNIVGFNSGRWSYGGGNLFSVSTGANIDPSGYGYGFSNSGTTGGGGESVIDEELIVVPGQTYNITVGAGGFHSASNKGGDGIAIIKYS